MINVSSPNTPGLRDLQDTTQLRRLVERFWAREFQDEGDALRIKQKEDARGDVVVLLEAMRRCLEVEVEVEARTPRGRAGRLVGDEVLGWLMARLEVV